MQITPRLESHKRGVTQIFLIKMDVKTVKQRDRVEMEVGGGIGMGNTCKSMADSCQCMTKTTTIL